MVWLQNIIRWDGGCEANNCTIYSPHLLVVIFKFKITIFSKILLKYAYATWSAVSKYWMKYVPLYFIGFSRNFGNSTQPLSQKQ